MSSPYLVDTNILLRLTNPGHPQSALASRSVNLLQDRGCDLFFTLQNASEFWNTCTRPAERNGLGLSIAVTEHHLNAIEQNLTLLPDTRLVYEQWRILIVQHSIRGVQVHDAKLAAAMLAHNVLNILTFNAADFARFTGITAVHPTTLNPV